MSEAILYYLTPSQLAGQRTTRRGFRVSYWHTVDDGRVKRAEGPFRSLRAAKKTAQRIASTNPKADCLVVAHWQQFAPA